MQKATDHETPFKQRKMPRQRADYPLPRERSDATGTISFQVLEFLGPDGSSECAPCDSSALELQAAQPTFR